MDIRFLNTALLQQLRENGFHAVPDAVVRVNQTFDGNSGEGYLMLFSGRLVTAERRIGEKEYQIHPVQEPPAETALTMRRNGSRLEVEFHSAGRSFQAEPCFGEADCAETMLRTWIETVPVTTAASGDNAAAATLDPADAEVTREATLFAAGLLFAAHADGEFPTEERNHLENHLPAAALGAGERYLAEKNFPEFIRDAKEFFSPEQLLSLLANQLEAMMSDGKLRSSEMEFLKNEAVELGIPLEEYRMMREYLLLKNQYPALFSL